MSFLFFSNAFKRYRTFIIPYLLGYAISPMASLLVYGDNVGPENIYKFHTGLMVSLLAFLVSEVRSPLLRVLRLSPIAASMVAFFENARSLAGVTLLAHIINIVAMRVRSGSHLKIKISWSRAALLALLFMVIGFSIFKSYTMAASNGWLGTEALEKYEMQATASESGEFSLFSGRQEIYFSLPKILESPLIGYGSWAKDWEYVYDMAQQRGVNAANATTGYGGMNELGLIPAHSHIFGAWLEAGLLGAIFWFSILVRTGRVLLKGSFVLTGRLSGVLAYLLLGFVWDIVFSPLGGERRVFEGFVVASLVHLEILDNVSIPRLLTSAAPAAFHRRTLMPKELSVG